jgi:uncharacterized glyoxalase superfamily protein PhnB
MAIELGVIEIVAADLAASLTFYRDLGIEIAAVAEDEDHVEARLSSGVTLAWDTAELIAKLDPAYRTPQGGHRMALAFKLSSPAEVDATFARITAAGHTGRTAPWDAFWGQRYATLIDPDGNAVDLYAILAS